VSALDPATLGEVHPFRETYDPWTGRAWLTVIGPTPVSLRIGPGYGAVRQALRAKFPDRPFDTSWADGRYPAAPYGLPVGLVTVGLTIVAVAAVVAGAFVGGPQAAIVVGAVLAWPLVRQLDAVDVTAAGIRVGPPWALRIPWSHVQAVGMDGATVWVRGTRGGATGTVPRVLVPAVRARIRSHLGRPPESGDGGLDVRYARWRAAASGIPWGVGLATAVGAWLAPEPWITLTGGGLVVVGLALLGAAVEARATGWGTGAIGWLTALYATISLLLALATL
jgi:hypothetical protein